MVPLAAESTTFSLDNMGRFICNTLQEAIDSAGQVVGGHTRGFDTIVVGGGTFGSVVAEHLFISDTTRSRRILVLEAGPYVLAEHVQNMPFVAPVSGAPDMRVPWVNHPALNYAGLLFAIGGRLSCVSTASTPFTPLAALLSMRLMRPCASVLRQTLP